MSIVILIVPWVSFELRTLIFDDDAPSGVDNPAIALPFCEMLKLFMISPISIPNPKGSSVHHRHLYQPEPSIINLNDKTNSRINACTVFVFATGAHGVSVANARSIFPISMLLIGPSAPSGFTNGTFSVSAWMPALSHEMFDPSACRADLPMACTGENCPLR